MKKLALKSVLFIGLMLGAGITYAQDAAAECPKKGTPECPIVNCPKKGTADCPYTANVNSTSTNQAFANCPKKGTKDCPIVLESKASYAAKVPATTKKKAKSSLPPCCQKEGK